MLLKDKVAIITGAGEGVGLATALRFAEEGAVVIPGAGELSAVKPLAQQIESKGGRAMPLAVDVTSESQVQHMVESVVRAYGRIDVLVNCAGGSTILKDLVDLDSGEWDRTIAANLKGVMMCCKHALRSMVAARRGSIINVAATEGRFGAPGRSALCASLWAVHGLSQSLAWEVGRYGIRVNCVDPGPPMSERLEGTLGASIWHGANPRPPETAEVADVIVYLASDRNYQMTGQAINVNRGSWFS